MQPEIVGIIVLIGMLILIAMGLHIGFAMGLAAIVGMSVLLGPQAALFNLALLPYSVTTNFNFVAIPLFILMGRFATESGIIERTFAALHKLLGRLPGGLGMATTGACAAFATCSGSSLAAAATMGKIAVPELTRYKYDKAFSCGIVAASGTLGILIPPSIDMIIIGVLMEVSVGRLFIAGFIPGILSALIYMGMMGLRAWRNPNLGPRVKGVSWRETITALPKLWGTLVLALLVLGGIYMGVFTPTEAAGVGSFIAFMMYLGFRKRLELARIRRVLLDTVKMTSVLFLLIVGGWLFARFMALSGLPARMGEGIIALNLTPLAVIGMISVLYVFLGTFLTTLPMIIITLPIFLPMVTNLGFNLIWFGILLIKVSEIGLITPPIGLNVFITQSAVPDVKVEAIFRHVVWFFFMDILTLGILIVFPILSLWLPTLMKG